MCCGSDTPRKAPVPKVIHQVWVGPPMPGEFAAFAARWRELHPGWDYRLWTEPELAQLDMANRSIYDAADRLTHHRHEAAQLRADVARYEILHSYGGVYLDTDIAPLRPLDPLIAGTSLGMAWETNGVHVGNSVIVAAPANPVLAAIIRGIPARIEGADPGWRPNNLTGPKYIGPIMLANRAQVSLWDQRTFFPIRWDNLDRIPDTITAEAFPGTFGVHLWANSRRRDGRAMPHLAEAVAS